MLTRVLDQLQTGDWYMCVTFAHVVLSCAKITQPWLEIDNILENVPSKQNSLTKSDIVLRKDKEIL